MCKTMFGFDLCSPNSGMTATGRKCHGTCHEDPQDDQGHYKCFVDSARTVLEHSRARCAPGDATTGTEPRCAMSSLGNGMRTSGKQNWSLAWRHAALMGAAAGPLS